MEREMRNEGQNGERNEERGTEWREMRNEGQNGERNEERGTEWREK
jgi:hypothetical protein